jgi:hypothetical protein
MNNAIRLIAVAFAAAIAIPGHAATVFKSGSWGIDKDSGGKCSVVYLEKTSYAVTRDAQGNVAVATGLNTEMAQITPSVQGGANLGPRSPTRAENTAPRSIIVQGDELKNLTDGRSMQYTAKAMTGTVNVVVNGAGLADATKSLGQCAQLAPASSTPATSVDQTKANQANVAAVTQLLQATQGGQDQSPQMPKITQPTPAAAPPAAPKTTGNWTPIGKPRCAATYATNTSANAMATVLIFPVSGNFTKVTVTVPAPGSTRMATNEEIQKAALVITGDELKRLIAGGTMQYELSGGFANKKTSVEVSGEGLSRALNKVKVLCAP